MSRAELPSLALLLQLVLCLDCCPVPHRFSHISEVWQMHTTLLTDQSKKGSTDTVPVTVHDAVIVAPGLQAGVCGEGCAQPSPENKSL